MAFGMIPCINKSVTSSSIEQHSDLVFEDSVDFSPPMLLRQQALHHLESPPHISFAGELPPPPGLTKTPSPSPLVQKGILAPAPPPGLLRLGCDHKQDTLPELQLLSSLSPMSDIPTLNLEVYEYILALEEIQFGHLTPTLRTFAIKSVANRMEKYITNEFDTRAINIRQCIEVLNELCMYPELTENLVNIILSNMTELLSQK